MQSTLSLLGSNPLCSVLAGPNNKVFLIKLGQNVSINIGDKINVDIKKIKYSGETLPFYHIFNNELLIPSAPEPPSVKM